MGEPFSPLDGEVRLKTLYVLLGRIGGLDECIWEEMNHQEQVDAFVSEYNTLCKAPETSGNMLEDRFTLDTVLRGTITAEDLAYKTAKSFTGAFEIKEETLLHRAISLIDYKDDKSNSDLKEIIYKLLITNLPFLLKYDRSHSSESEYDGQSALHLAVLKENAELVRRIARAMVEEGFSLDPVARGTKFDGTVMMAGTPLCVAALKLNTKLFKILIKEGADIAGTNKDSENVCHSLVRYAHHFPDKLDKICKMLNFILKCSWKKGKDRKIINETQKLLMMENKDGLNPLQLATKLRLHQIFKELFSFEVYCKKNLRDALRDDQWYDVTEIDTLPVPTDNGNTVARKEDHVSLLPTILMQSPQSAIKFLEFPPIRQVIEQKWSQYRWIVGAWGIVHLAFMIVLIISAVRRADLTNDPVSNINESASDRPNFIYKVPNDAFVTAISIIGFLIGVAYIFLQIKRFITGYYQKSLESTNLYKAFKYPHSNIIYKCLFVLFSVCLILDFIIALSQVDTYENYMLMAAVIMGSYLMLFFIQMVKPFSFFTALIQIAMVDLARFAIVMIIFLVAFSTAMYMVMQGADTEDDTFRSYDSTVMKMLNVMLGLGDIDTLFNARHPYAAVVVLVVFVLLTTLLLLNALLAIMANTCSDLLSRYGDVTAYKLHYRLHKLSTILFIEDILPHSLQKSVGEIQKHRRFKNGKKYNESRRMVPHSCLTTKDENIQEEFSAMEGLLHYFRGRTSKRKDKGKNGTKISPTMRQRLTPSFTAGRETTDVQTMEQSYQPAYTNRDLPMNGRHGVHNNSFVMEYSTRSTS